MAIYRAATDDAAAVAERLSLASRAAAVSRFEDVWPSTQERSIPTRRLLRDWYLRVYQQHLDHGVGAPVDSPIDGNRAEQVFIKVRDKSGASTDVVIDTVLTLARDAREFADRVSTAQECYVSTALAGRLGTVLPRRPDTQVSVRQAIGEQWYLRAFRAELDPVLFRVQTRPIGQREIAQVVDALAAGSRHRPLDVPPGPPVPDSEAERQRQAALAWKALPDHRRLLWLTQHDLDGRRYFSRRWNKLPAPIRDLLVAQLDEPPLQSRPHTNRPEVALFGPVDAAAKLFGAPAVRPAGAVEFEAAEALFHRGGVAFPPGLLGDQPIEPLTTALARLKKASPLSKETRGLPRQGWWTDKATLDRAVKLRMDGADWVQIGRELGITASRARRGLQRHGDLDAVFTQPKPRREWTAEELATVAALRAKGHGWNDIAALIGRPSGGAVRVAVFNARRKAQPAEPARALDRTHGGERRSSLGL